MTDIDAVKQYLLNLQDTICKAVTDFDGSRFENDEWLRPEGGGGRTRSLNNGSVF